MASATLDLQLPSQPQGIAAHWLLTNYTAWWQRHMCVNNLPRLHSTAERPGFELVTCWSQIQRPNQTTRPPSHTGGEKQSRLLLGHLWSRSVCKFVYAGLVHRSMSPSQSESGADIMGEGHGTKHRHVHAVKFCFSFQQYTKRPSLLCVLFCC